MTTWFTSDTHFWHRRMAEEWRAFGSVEEMNDALVASWNASVRPGDAVWHLGDFSFGNRERTWGVRERLNGQILLVRGNHDQRRDRELFAEVHDYVEFKRDGRLVVLCHYPIQSWNEVHHGSWHLHGHCHGNLPNPEQLARLDVGVDPHGLRPWSWEEIEAELGERRGVPGDHHR